MEPRNNDSSGGNGDAGGQSNTPGAGSGGLWPRLLGSLWAPRRPGPGTAAAASGAGNDTSGRAGGAARGGVWVGAPAAVAPDNVRPARRVDQGPVRQGAGEAAGAGAGRGEDGEAEGQQQQQQHQGEAGGQGDGAADGGEAAEDDDGSEGAAEGGCREGGRGARLLGAVTAGRRGRGGSAVGWGGTGVTSRANEAHDRHAGVGRGRVAAGYR